jgi:hypothetical protein
MGRHPTQSSSKNNDMTRKLLITIILSPTLCCDPSFKNNNAIDSLAIHFTKSMDHTFQQTVLDIATPAGFKRKRETENTFTEWLRKIRIKKDSRVYLYNGQLKQNQTAQFAVLDIPVGKKDLQQCADAVMRLRAEHLLHSKKIDEISFADNNGKKYTYSLVNAGSFEKYLEKVFTYCGTASLEKQMRRVNDLQAMQCGDVFIQGGSPGHAVIVIDMAVHPNGKKVFLLAQSYMPAQDIHILKNPVNPDLSPWYELQTNALVFTPEWTFEPRHLRRW